MYGKPLANTASYSTACCFLSLQSVIKQHSSYFSARQYYLYSDDFDNIAHPITIVSIERDLGVTFERDLKFTDLSIKLWRRQTVY